MKSILLQSLYAPPWPEWIAICLSQTENWAARAGCDYHLMGDDELFGENPGWFTRACQRRILPQTDLGRLLAMRRALRRGYDRVIWLDADVLIFDASFDLANEVMAREAWVSHATNGGFRVTRGVNNSVMAFVAGSAVLPAYIDAALGVAAGWRGETPDQRALGPDLLATRPEARAAVLAPDAAMFSPMLTAALARGDAGPLRAHAAIWRGPVRAANLCSSLITDDQVMLTAVETLLADPAIAAPAPGPPPQDSTPADRRAIW